MDFGEVGRSEDLASEFPVLVAEPFDVVAADLVDLHRCQVERGVALDLQRHTRPRLPRSSADRAAQRAGPCRVPLRPAPSGMRRIPVARPARPGHESCSARRSSRCRSSSPGPGRSGRGRWRCRLPGSRRVGRWNAPPPGGSGYGSSAMPCRSRLIAWSMSSPVWLHRATRASAWAVSASRIIGTNWRRVT